MELHSKSATVNGKAIIITVEELERRKERFRRATEEYYEQAERGYRSLYGFCSQHTGKRKIMEESKETSLPLRRKSLKRCRRRRNQIQVPELEADLARSLLESHFAIVELATKEYLFSIRNFICPAPSLFRPSHQLSRVTLREGEGFLLRVPTISPMSMALPLPLPVAFNTTQQGECLETRLLRHISEITEEQDMAMASAMQAAQESKITEGLAKKIHQGTDSIRVALKKISALIEANRNNTFYCCHYDSFQSETEPTFDTKSALTMNQKGGTSAISWDRKVVEAQKLDGYYSWFRANNGVLLIQNKKGDHSIRSKITNGNVTGSDIRKTCQFELGLKSQNLGIQAGSPPVARKRVRRGEISILGYTP
eukprot:CAMPEP_0116138454 /NCGR_PEP_ID=MMETSP0329-20121206/12792_1 /TAXON_ID=697910 /ORGANISM="Pseudo-nitzschia arenysensis, Strain B593" /LENGTH=367 /DNA_ID=CAMNT_0003633441 /DNA_START=354 /DNA_END=1454 /DNA_ORIENTATION=+